MREQAPIHDMSIETGIESKPGLELAKGEGFDAVVDIANYLAGKIERDEPIKVEQVMNLDEALGKIKIDVGGDQMTLAEARRIPDLGSNLEIYKMFERQDRRGLGLFKSDYEQMTYLPIKIARILIRRSAGSVEYLYLGNIKVISDEVAQEISNFRGTVLLNGLETLTDIQADHLANIYGVLTLYGLKNISDAGLGSLLWSNASLDVRFSKDIQKKFGLFSRTK